MAGGDSFSEWLIVPEPSVLPCADDGGVVGRLVGDLVLDKAGAATAAAGPATLAVGVQPLVEGGDADADRRRDEANVMAAMYGQDFVEISPTEWLFSYSLGKGVAGEMRMSLPDDYPSTSMPGLVLDIPACGDLEQTRWRFIDEFVPGSEVAFAWAERFHQVCREAAKRLRAVVSEREADRAARFRLPSVVEDEREERRGFSNWELRQAAVDEAGRRCYQFAGSQSGPSRAELAQENHWLRLEAEERRRREEQQRRNAVGASWRAVESTRVRQRLGALSFGV
eukprot:CAMPEP_0171091538 /NCGR_PEP_ID=MMETSP0766_2-20121228/33915_1 /TAXON_ID=439317 /ORGANISM="Gambierdiscus australes, Strain CAWD 149" /LENGTH=281 /DNA_ID=CAMNT_0011549653 /DNA_START=54 /DNA_END=899 /DNA_ORIENTATION=+